MIFFRTLRNTANYLTAALEQLGFIILSKGVGKGLPLVAFRLNPKHNHHYDEVRLRISSPDSADCASVCTCASLARARLDCACIYNGSACK